MQRKRILAVIPGLILIVTLTGCGRAGNSGNASTTAAVAITSAASGSEAALVPAPPKPVTLTFFTNSSSVKSIDLSATPVGKKITELTGVTLKCDYLIGMDEKTKAGIMVASGEYPDLLNPDNETQAFLDSKALLPLEDMLAKYGANLTKAYGKDLKRFIRTDGHTYQFSSNHIYQQNLYPQTGMYLAKDVLKQAGYPVVKDINVYFQMIEDYAVKNPTFNGKPVIPFTGETEEWKIYMVTNVPQYLEGNYNTGDCSIDLKTYEGHAFQLDKSAHDYFLTLNNLWNKGMVDKEMFTQKADALYAKIAEGRVLGFFDERYNILDTITAMEKAGLYDRIPFAVPAVNPGVARDPYNTIQTTASTGGICITTSCKDPVAAFKFLDAMTSEPVEKLKWWGIEGTDYTVANGIMTQNDQQKANLDDPTYLQKEGIFMFDQFPRMKFGLDGKFSDGNFVCPKDTPDYIKSKYKPYEQEIADAYKVTNLADMCAPGFDSPFGFGWDIPIPDTEKEVNTAVTKAYDLVNRIVPQLIMCKAGEYEALWAKYSADMKAIPYNAAEPFKTKEAQRRVAAWK